jgi:hypothetical protein
MGVTREMHIGGTKTVASRTKECAFLRCASETVSIWSYTNNLSFLKANIKIPAPPNAAAPMATRTKSKKRQCKIS